MAAFLYLVALVIFVIAAVLFWPAHAPALACIGLAIFAGAGVLGVTGWPPKPPG